MSVGTFSLEQEKDLEEHLCHLVLLQPLTCGCFPKDVSEFLNFKFTSKVALIHVNIISLQIQILLC
jgi:hypothetical protein